MNTMNSVTEQPNSTLSKKRCNVKLGSLRSKLGKLSRHCDLVMNPSKVHVLEPKKIASSPSLKRSGFKIKGKSSGTDSPGVWLPLTTETKAHVVGMTELHEWNKYRTLQEIVNAVEHSPSCLSKTNVHGQTPLHLAISSGIQCEIILFLIKAFPQACWTMDEYGRLPLHYAATSSRWTIPCNRTGTQYVDWFEEDKPEEATYDANYEKMLRALCLIYPKGATHEDHAEMNPIELCLIDETPSHVFVKIIQQASRGHWKGHAVCKI